MKSDADIQKDVMDQLKWEPFLKASEIGVAVKNGIVTLTGQVDSYLKKMAAERATRNVYGVRAIAEDIQIGVSPAFKKTDMEIADAVLNALKWHSAVPEEGIRVKVENGVVTLEGEADWDYQRSSANNAIENIVGVKDIHNNITVRARITQDDLKQKISAAFHRSATIDARSITVEITGNKAVLKGHVRSYAEKEDAKKAALAAPGITSVDNKLDIEYEPLKEMTF